MPLTDVSVRTAKGRATAYKLADGGGLYVLVRSSDARYWRWTTVGVGSVGHWPSASTRWSLWPKRGKKGIKRRNCLRVVLTPARNENSRGC